MDLIRNNYQKSRDRYLSLKRNFNNEINDNEETIYYIHDNGGRPFRVTIKGKQVKVFKQLAENEGYYQQPIITVNSDKIFIGESPENEMTRFSGGFGPDFDGNTILVKLSSNWYMFIGWEIYNFESIEPIVEYQSPVGNNDVPYPYAIDAEGNYYLLTENVIILSNPELKEIDDIYSLYYEKPKQREIDIETQAIEKTIVVPRDIAGTYFGEYLAKVSTLTK